MKLYSNDNRYSTALIIRRWRLFEAGRLLEEYGIDID